MSRRIWLLLGSAGLTASLRLCSPQLSVGIAVAAAPPRRCPAPACAEPDSGDGDGSGSDLGSELNRLLDTPLLDPSQESDNEPRLLRDFKTLFNRDRELAEALYAGGVFAVLLFFSQQGVRVYKHCIFMPDDMCPWDAGGGVDPLGLF